MGEFLQFSTGMLLKNGSHRPFVINLIFFQDILKFTSVSKIFLFHYPRAPTYQIGTKFSFFTSFLILSL